MWVSNFETKFSHLVFGFWYYFVICALALGFSVDVYAADLGSAQGKFLQGEYEDAATECEDVLISSPPASSVPQVYYLLGQCYVKLGNYLRAGDTFEVIINEYKNSAIVDAAYLGLADTYFLREDFTGAEKLYNTILEKFPNSQLRGVIYFRLGQAALKQGHWQEAEQLLKKVRQEYSGTFEAGLVGELLGADRFFTVQVGSFGTKINAQNLSDKLAVEGFSPYIVEMDAKGRRLYRVRIGKLNSREDAKKLEESLKEKGYPTHIFP